MAEGSFGQGSGRILLYDVQCIGNERKLMSCAYSSSVNDSCTHAQEAGVRCMPGMMCVCISQHLPALYNLSKGCTGEDVRLVEGRTEQEGRVEICTANTWGTICHHGWDTIDARVVCRQLGYSVAGSHYYTLERAESLTYT